MRFHILLFSAVILLVASCTSRKHLVYLKNIEGQTKDKEYQVQNIEYKLRKGDIVYLKILSTNSELSELFNPSDFGMASMTSAMSYMKGFTINDSGNIKIPIIKSINIEGLTINEAERVIQKKVDEYLNNTTLIVKFVSFNVNVLGEVNLPGTKEIFQSKTNILEIMGRAGDIRETGDKKNVLVLRNVGDKMVAYTIDLTDDSIISSDKFTVMPDDIIIVQPLKLKAFRLNTQAISLVLSAITTMLLIYTTVY